LPILEQDLEQTRGEQRGAVPRPLALLDAQDVAVRIDVANAEGHDLAHTQAGGVGGEQQRAVLEPSGLREEPRELLAAY
jgi:hypothetical protein